VTGWAAAYEGRGRRGVGPYRPKGEEGGRKKVLPFSFQVKFPNKF